MPDVGAPEDTEPDAALVEAALAVFVSLPPVQRSAIALKDVLGHSLAETATTMGTTVLAVKGALVRARANIAATASSTPSISAEEMTDLRRYARYLGPVSTQPDYFIRLQWEQGRVVRSRDFYYVRYIAREACFTRG